MHNTVRQTIAYTPCQASNVASPIVKLERAATSLLHNVPLPCLFTDSLGPLVEENNRRLCVSLTIQKDVRCRLGLEWTGRSKGSKATSHSTYSLVQGSTAGHLHPPLYISCTTSWPFFFFFFLIHVFSSPLSPEEARSAIDANANPLVLPRNYPTLYYASCLKMDLWQLG